jgi:threonine dehydrogenase-like Zn-dependent dehydrogenase
LRGTLIYGPGDVRFEQREDPKIIEPTDAVITMSATCVCPWDLREYRGAVRVSDPMPAGHEYCGIVEQIGAAVQTIRPGQFVVGGMIATDNTCPNCHAGYQGSCTSREYIAADAQRSGINGGGAQAERLRVPLADGTLVATPELPSRDLIPSLLTCADVLPSAWFGLVAAEVAPGKTVVVNGDSTVGMLSVLGARHLGAERIIIVSPRESRQKLALDFGATDIVSGEGDEGVAQIRELTDGLGAHSVIDMPGTRESMTLAIGATRPGGHVGMIGVSPGLELSGEEVFFSQVHLHGGPPPVRQYLPRLVDLIWTRQIDPGRVFDLVLPLEEVAEGYRALDEGRAFKPLLWP